MHDGRIEEVRWRELMTDDCVMCNTTARPYARRTSPTELRNCACPIAIERRVEMTTEMMMLAGDFFAGFLVAVLYVLAMVSSGYVVAWAASLFSRNRRMRWLAGIIFGAAQLQFVLDVPASAMIESMNVTHVLVSQSHTPVPIVAIGEMAILRSLQSMITHTNVGPLASNLIDSAATAGVILRLEQTYDEIASGGVLSCVIRNAWRSVLDDEMLPWRSREAGTAREWPLSVCVGTNTAYQGGPVYADSGVHQLGSFSRYQFSSKAHHDFRHGRLLGGAGSVDVDAENPQFTPPASAVPVDGQLWNVGIDGRPYYVVYSKPSGRSKTGRHSILCGSTAHSLGGKVKMHWLLSDGQLTHDGILRKMRDWAQAHSDDRRLSLAEEKPDEPNGAEENPGAVEENPGEPDAAEEKPGASDEKLGAAEEKPDDTPEMPDEATRAIRARKPQQRPDVDTSGSRAVWNRDLAAGRLRTRVPQPKGRRRASVVRAPGVAGAFATAAAKSSAATMMRQASPLLGSNGDFEARAFVEQFVEPELARLNHEAALAKARESQAKRDAAKAQEVADEAKRLLALNTENHAKERHTIEKLVGVGFNSDRYLRMHVREWCQRIQSEYEGDTKKQVMLAQGIAERLALKVHSAHTPSEVSGTCFS